MKERSILGELLSWLIYIVIVVILSLGIITFIGQRTKVSGHSMETTLSDGDNLIVDKLTYRFSDPKRFDIIVFPYKYEENTYFIKRIIGLPGETIQVTDGKIYINGQVLDESYGREVLKSGGIAETPITLGEDEYFVMGDNRNDSMDSRDPSVGVLHKSELVGRAWGRILPLSKFGILRHQ